MIRSLVLALMLFVPYGTCLRRLRGQIPDTLDIEPGSISASGVSAGSAMAIQIHVAHSAEVKGVGIFAGPGPYYCAKDSLTFALGRCMVNPANIPVAGLIDDTEAFAARGDIDDTSNLQGSKVFIWHGGFDETVHPGTSVAINQFYDHYLSDVKYPCINQFDAGHAQPVVDNPGGVANDDCGATSSPYVNVCDYDGAFHALDQIYDNTLVQPSRPVDLTGDLIEFDQSDYILNPGGISLGDSGFVYVPTACNTATCKLHIALHGCLMDYNTVDTDYVRYGGYNEVADANNITILYPQVARSLSIPYNPNGCFDWWGYNDGAFASEYATKAAPQIEAIWSMATNQRIEK